MTRVDGAEINVLGGFVPDMFSEISMNPGERGMQMKVRFRDGAPVRFGERKDAAEVRGERAA